MNLCGEIVSLPRSAYMCVPTTTNASQFRLTSAIHHDGFPPGLAALFMSLAHNINSTLATSWLTTLLILFARVTVHHKNSLPHPSSDSHSSRSPCSPTPCPLIRRVTPNLPLVPYPTDIHPNVLCNSTCVPPHHLRQASIHPTTFIPTLLHSFQPSYTLFNPSRRTSSQSQSQPVTTTITPQPTHTPHKKVAEEGKTKDDGRPRNRTGVSSDRVWNPLGNHNEAS